MDIQVQLRSKRGRRAAEENFSWQKNSRGKRGGLIFWNEPLFSWRSGKVFAHFEKNGNFEKIERNFPHDKVNRVLQNDTIVITSV